MDEQTLSLIEAFAKLRASSEDLDEIKLAQKKVRTPEGVEKYGQPIGTIITKDMIEKAAQKAKQLGGAGSGSSSGGKTSTSTSSGSTNAPSASTKMPSAPVIKPPTEKQKAGGAPGGQTSADINNFFVSKYVNNPSAASIGWVEKPDGQWYKQTYKDGKVANEMPLDDAQVNALVEMEKKGLVYSGFIGDPEPETQEQKSVNKLKEAIDSGKTLDDPGVQKLVGSFQPKKTEETAAPKKDSDSKAEPSTPAAEKSSGKTVKINGKDVKVGRYSRPKGFAKAFLIVNEDGTVEYENKTGARKKISHNAFDKHQELGMNKFLTADTSAIKKDQHFEDGKLVSDKDGADAASPAKVEAMKTPTPEPKSASVANKPAESAPKPTFTEVGSTAQAKPSTPDVEAPKPKQDSTDAGTVKIGSLTVKPGRYSRPKGFAKAFLIVHKDGTAEYENKKGERKKLSANGFEGHWKLGMNKFLTSETRPLKKDESYENGKLVNSGKDSDSVDEPKPSLALEAAKKAAAELKAKQEAENKAAAEKKAAEEKAAEEKAAKEAYAAMVAKKAKEAAEKKAAEEKAAADKKAAEKAEAEAQAAEKSVKVIVKNTFGHEKAFDVPEGTKLYATSKEGSNPNPPILYYKDKDGHYVKLGASTGKKKIGTKEADDTVDQFISEGNLVEWQASPKKTQPSSDKDSIYVSLHPSKKTEKFPKGTKFYVNPEDQNKTEVYSYIAVEPDGSVSRVSSLTGKHPKEGLIKASYLEEINKGSLVSWAKYTTKDDSAAGEDFYVLIQGKPAQLVPAGTKVYHLSFLEDNEIKAKYYKDVNDHWHVVTSDSHYKANATLAGNLDDMFKAGSMKEDTKSPKDGKAYTGSPNTATSQAENSVSAEEEITPVASPTEVKSVKIAGMDIKPGKYSIGKEFAKAFLVVHPDGTAYYVNKKGESKKLTPAAFKKNWEAGMNKYAGPLEGAMGPAQAESKPTVVSGLKAGTYSVKQSGVAYGAPEMSYMEVKSDGSAIFKQNGIDIPLTAEQTIQSAQYGNIMDEFGNSVVLPNGKKPDSVYVFGSQNSMTVDQLKSLRDELVSTDEVLATIKKHAGYVSPKLVLAYIKHNFPGTPDASKKAALKAIDDILTPLENKQASKPSAAGVTDPAKYLFEQDSQGNFTVPVKLSTYDQQNLYYMQASEANALIKKISEAFGGKVAKGKMNMTLSARRDWLEAYLQGDFKTMYYYEKNAGMDLDPAHPGAPNNKDTHKISWSPAVAGEKSAGKIPDGSWSYSVNVMSSEEIDNYLIAANMTNPTHLSSHHKKMWVKYHMQGNQVKVDQLSLEAQEHAKSSPNYPYTNPVKWTSDVKPKKAYTDYVENNTSADEWTTEALKQYVQDFPQSVPAHKKDLSIYDKVDDVNNYLATIAAEKAAKEAAEYAEKMKPKFQKAPGQSVSGGHHEAMVLVDQFGQKWVYKPREEKDIFLADVEQGSHDLARLWGYKTAKSMIIDFDGRKGHVQQMFDAEKDLNGVSMSSLNSAQIQDLAKEHLLDWALDNDDSWGANLLMLKNGSIVGIDKGRAYVGVGHWNGLSGDSSAHVHMPLVYTDLYNAIANKTISQEDANAAYFAVLKQARKMEKLSDARMTEILEDIFKNRKNWVVGGGPNSKEGAIKAAIDRKNSLVSDMETLWGKVFDKAGYDKPEAPSGVVVNDSDQEIHLGITPAALNQAKENGSFGASVFFGGSEIEDAHLLLYATKTKGGVEMLNGEMKIRETSKAFKDVETWLKSNAVKVDNAYGFTPANMEKTLPNQQDYYDKIIAGVKTISAHALDGQYNETTLNGMSWVKNTLKNYVDDYDTKMSDPATQADLVKQYKDPEAFMEMAQKYLGYIAKAEQHKANGTKSVPGEFDAYKWIPKTEEVETPKVENKIKVELRAASSAKASMNGTPKFEPDGSLKHSQGYTTDGNPGSMYLVTLPTGETIEFRGNTTGTPATSKGLTRFTLAAGENEAASLERIRTQMAVMGLKMEESSEDDLELYYWRHLAGIMDTRADSKKTASQYDKTASSDKYKKFQATRPVETSGMSATEEIEAWRNAFANITSRDQIDDFVGSGGHLPKFGHYHTKDVSKYSGQPYWERFDVTDEQAFSKQMMGSTLSDASVAEYLTFTGGMLSTEARLRTLGLWKEGMSSTADMSHGSSGFVFVRQNKDVSSGTASYNLPHIFYSPKVLKRTHNYSFNDDKYGEMKYKGESSYFDFDKIASNNGGTNELMIKHAVSLLDDIEIVTFEDEDMRARAIKALKDLGIDEIRGVPVEKRFVMRNTSDIIQAQKIAKEAWKTWNK